MKRLALAALLALAACQPPPDRRGDAPGYAERALADYSGTKVEYFLVEGVDPAAITESMRERKLGGVEKNGRFAVGLTRWAINWRWPVRYDGSCDLSRLDLVSNVTVVLPQLANENASPDIKRQWGNFVADVVAHEVGHVRLIYEHKPKIIDAIVHSDCANAENAGRAAIAALQAANDAFDAAADAGTAPLGKF